VGCDVAAETLGAVFKWPVMTKEVTEQGLVTDKDELVPAQTVIISIGDVLSLPFLPESVEVVKIAGVSWIKTDEAVLAQRPDKPGEKKGFGPKS
jgi:hypothetical protein